MYYVLAIGISLIVGGAAGYFLAPDVAKEVTKAKADFAAELAKLKDDFAAEKGRIKALLKEIETDLQADVAILRARVAAVGKLL